MEQQSRQLQLMVNSLVTENMDLKNKIQSVERKLQDIKRSRRNLKNPWGQLGKKTFFNSELF